MKSSMQKLAVFVMMAAIALFVAAATASAFDRDDHRNAIVGDMAFQAGAIVSPRHLEIGTPITLLL